MGHGEASDLVDLVCDARREFSGNGGADRGGDTMDDVLGPSTIGVDVRGPDGEDFSVEADLSLSCGTLVIGGGQVGFKAEVVFGVTFDSNELEALGSSLLVNEPRSGRC